MVRVVQGVSLGVKVKPGSTEGVRVMAKGEATASPEDWRERTPIAAATSVISAIIWFFFMVNSFSP
jgi:hypothetical protein